MNSYAHARARARVTARRIARAPTRIRRRRMVRRSAAILRQFGNDIPASDWQAYRQILRGTHRIGRAARDMGISTAEAADTMRRFGQALREAYPEGPPLAGPPERP